MSIKIGGQKDRTEAEEDWKESNQRQPQFGLVSNYARNTLCKCHLALYVSLGYCQNDIGGSRMRGYSPSLHEPHRCATGR